MRNKNNPFKLPEVKVWKGIFFFFSPQKCLYEMMQYNVQ